jgi:hypothetical protein
MYRKILLASDGSTFSAAAKLLGHLPCSLLVATGKG